MTRKKKSAKTLEASRASLEKYDIFVLFFLVLNLSSYICCSLLLFFKFRGLFIYRKISTVSSIDSSVCYGGDRLDDLLLKLTGYLLITVPVMLHI